MATTFAPCGVVTITTDFGHKGPFVGTMKGVILTRFPQARIIDVTHSILAHWPSEAGFWLSRAFRYYPEGSVHMAVVDPGVGTQRDVIVAVREKHCFVAPDNGLLAPVIRSGDLAFRVSDATLAGLGIESVSATFHGRDIFAPLAADLAANRLRPEQTGTQATDIVPAWLEDPTVTDDHVTGQVITVDNFGNLITNIDQTLVTRFANPTAHVAGLSMPWKRTYGEAEPGQYLALINSFGVVEIARAEQSAADGLGVERGAPVRVSETVADA